MLFWLERARHSHILQVYRHPTSIQTPYKYTDTLQVYSIQNTSPDTQIQVQTPKYESRHPNTSPDTKIQVQTPKCKSKQVMPSLAMSDCGNESEINKMQVQTPKIQVHTSQILFGEFISAYIGSLDCSEEGPSPCVPQMTAVHTWLPPGPMLYYI